jgi:selenide,water dikinase
VGLETPDDAAVWRLDDERLLVMTTDFFTPVVDDPFDYGAIAAANSLSDVYAMGAEPFMALTIAALPPDLPLEISTEMMRGLAEKAAEAGTIIAGGHTIQDKEPKIGLVALGFVPPDGLLRKDGLQVGDCLILTKPLGFGVTTTALKQGKAAADDVAEVVSWMKRLNDRAGKLAGHFKLRAGTDITGFGFMGHAWEMAAAAGVGLKIRYSAMPFTSAAKKYARMGCFPGGASDNLMYYGDHVRFEAQIPEEETWLLFDPQTSGGLLLGVPADRLEAFLEMAESENCPAWEIGEVAAGHEIIVTE